MSHLQNHCLGNPKTRQVIWLSESHRLIVSMCKKIFHVATDSRSNDRSSDGSSNDSGSDDSGNVCSNDSGSSNTSEIIWPPGSNR